LNPNNAAAHYFYAIGCLIPMKRIDDALEQYQTALSLDPLSSIVNTNYAVLLMEGRRYPESLAQFQKVLERDPNFHPAHYKLSQLYATTGRFAEAVSEIQKIVSKPGSWSADAKSYRELLQDFQGTDRSGPAVVMFVLTARLLSSLMPVALLWITKLIIDGIVHAASTQQPVPRQLRE